MLCVLHILLNVFNIGVLSDREEYTNFYKWMHVYIYIYISYPYDDCDIATPTLWGDEQVIDPEFAFCGPMNHARMLTVISQRQTFFGEHKNRLSTLSSRFTDRWASTSVL